MYWNGRIGHIKASEKTSTGDNRFIHMSHLSLMWDTYKLTGGRNRSMSTGNKRKEARKKAARVYCLLG